MLKKVAVIGANGFVGQALCGTLRQAGHMVFPLARPAIDLLDPAVQSLLEATFSQVDAVVMLSAITPDKGKDARAFEHNLRMVMPIVAALKQVPVSQCVYISSDAVYHPSVSWVDQDTLPAPADLYGCMHLSREQLLASLNQPLWIVRPTLIYGRQDTHNAYGPNRFIRSAIQHQRIQLFGEGEEKRSHIAVEDVATLLCQGIEKGHTGVSLAVTTPSISFRALAELIQAYLPFPVTVQGQVRSNPITHRHFETSGLLSDFPQFSPRPIQAGLQAYIQAELATGEQDVLIP